MTRRSRASPRNTSSDGHVPPQGTSAATTSVGWTGTAGAGTTDLPPGGGAGRARGGRSRQLPVRGGARADDRGQRTAGVEAGVRAGVAGGAHLVHLDQQGVAVAVDAHGLHVLGVPGRVALAPVLLPGPAP